jgi:hypothetical protein
MSREELNKSIQRNAHEGLGSIGWPFGMFCILAIAVLVSGCANVKPVINADGDGKGGGGGFAFTTDIGNGWGYAIGGGCVVYLGKELIDASKDKSNTYTYYGDVYTAGNDIVSNSQNRDTPKRVRSEECLKRRK